MKVRVVLASLIFAAVARREGTSSLEKLNLYFFF